MSALDIPKLYRTARNRFTVRDDRTGQLLGHALLLPGVLVENVNVKLVPWFEDDLLVDDPDLAVKEKIDTGEDEEEVSELDITESSSISSLGSACQINPVTVVTAAGKDTFKLQGDQTPATNYCSKEVTKCRDLENNNTINSVKEVKEPPHERINEIIDNYGKEKAKDQKLNCVTYQDLEKESEHNPWNNEGMYDRFIDVVEESKFDEGGIQRNRRYWRVRCILCADGKIHSYPNIGRHIEKMHEPCITCEICGAEFTMKRNLARHRIRAHKERASDGCSKNAGNLSPLKLSSKTRSFKSITPVIASEQKRKPNFVGSKPTDKKKEEPLKKSSINGAISNSDLRISRAREVEVKTLKNTDVNIHPINNELQSSGSNCRNGEKSSSSGEGSSKVGAVRDKKLPCHVVAPHSGDKDDDLLPVTMISDHDKNISIKIGLRKDVKMKKAMKKFASRFDTDYKQLSFVGKKTETNIEFTLTGNELVEDMKGGSVKVLGIISDHRKRKNIEEI